jgi:arylesterase/paraoxonase
MAYKYAEGKDKPQPMRIDGFGDDRVKQLHPLGIAYRAESRTLYVVNHSKTGSTVEVFTVSEDATTLIYLSTIKHPLLPTPNSVLPISTDEIYITNDHKWVKKDQPLLAEFESVAAYPGGSVIYMNFATNETRKVAELPFANGITQLSGNRIAVASTTLPAVYIYAVDPKSHALTLLRKLRTQFWPDNLSTDSNGKLLIAGNPWAIKMAHIAQRQHKYDFDGHGEAVPGLLSPDDAPRSGSWVAEWDGNDAGELRKLYVGDEFHTSTSAVRDVKRGMGLVSGLYERGLLVWNE